MNIARSNLRFPSQVLFIGLHAVGIIFGLAYNSKTQDLYPNNSHQKLGWVLTGIIAVQFILGAAKDFKNIRTNLCIQQSTSPFVRIQGIVVAEAVISTIDNCIDD